MFMSLHVSIMPFSTDSIYLRPSTKLILNWRQAKNLILLSMRGSMDKDWKGQKEFTAGFFKSVEWKAVYPVYFCYWERRGGLIPKYIGLTY